MGFGSTRVIDLMLEFHFFGIRDVENIVARS
jgi:hypothetical protein